MNANAPPAVDVPASERRTPLTFLLRALLAASLVLLVAGGLHYYLGQRLLVAPGLPVPLQLLGWLMLGAGFVSIPLAFWLGRVGPRRLAAAVSWGAFLWMGAFGLLLTAVAATDLLRGLWSQVSGQGGLLAFQVQGAAVVGTVFPAFVYGLWRAHQPAVVERLQVPMRDLGPSLSGLKVVQLSDVHIGPTLRRAFLEQLVNKVNALSPDLVAITGDLVDGSVESLREELSPLSGLKAPFGVFFVTGNHEYYAGAAEWEAELTRLGVKVLHNQHVVLRRGEDTLVVAGLTDLEGARFGPEHAPRPDHALAGAPPQTPRLLLSHQPRAARLLAGHRVDLQLSGHTHGGQFFPWMFFVRLQQPVLSGMEEVAGVRVYTHRGTGYWGPPIRIGAPPEIAELTLVSA